MHLVWMCRLYYSNRPGLVLPQNVTYEEVNMPVTVLMVIRRGCDKVFFNYLEEMYQAGAVV